jgi:hypothetical protein
VPPVSRPIFVASIISFWMPRFAAYLLLVALLSSSTKLGTSLATFPFCSCLTGSYSSNVLPYHLALDAKTTDGTTATYSLKVYSLSEIPESDLPRNGHWCYNTLAQQAYKLAIYTSEAVDV